MDGRIPFLGSFRARVAGAAMLTTCVALLAAFCVFFVRQWTSERRQFVEDRTVSAQVMASNLAAPLLFADAAAARDTLRSARKIPDFVLVRVFDAQGRLFAEVAEAKLPPAFRAQTLPATPVRYRDGHVEIRTPVTIDRRPVGDLVLVLGLHQLSRLAQDFLVSALVCLVLVAGGAGIMSLWIANRVMAPVHKLSRAMAGVRRSGDFSGRVATTSKDELGQLTGDFNTLLDTLEQNDRRLQQTMADLVGARDVAEAASVAKSQFLANMSHEIRTPLNGVLGMAQVMATDELSDAQRQRLDVIASSGKGLLSLLNDLLDLAKIEAARLEFETIEFDLEEVIHGACNPFAGVAQTKGLGFSTNIADAARGVWLGDPMRVRQIVGNLVSNAVKFTRGGEVRVDVARAADGGLSFSVTDTGMGIPADSVAILFDKFSQADASTTREFGGTGLGLSISRELAYLMDGDIAVESEEGVGSVFRVNLPLKWLRPPAQPSKPGAAGRPADTLVEREQGVAHILVAEDNLTNQLVLKAMLEPADVELTIVSNGAEAVEAWRTGAFDLVLMDVQMPVMDGVEATRAIRALAAEMGRPRIPIIALTANAMKHQVEQYRAAGMDGHVAKPIEAAVLYAALDAALSDDAGASAAA